MRQKFVPIFYQQWAWLAVEEVDVIQDAGRSASSQLAGWRKSNAIFPEGWGTQMLWHCHLPVKSLFSRKHQHPDWEYETNCIHMHSLYAGRPEGCHQGMTTWRSISKTESTVGKTEHRTQGCQAPIPVQLKKKMACKKVFSSRNQKWSCNQMQEELEGESVGQGEGRGLSGYYFKGSGQLTQPFHAPLSPSSRGSLVSLHFLSLQWCHLHIWGCRYFSQLSWF